MMSAIEIKGLEPLAKHILGQILSEYDYEKNIATITPDIPNEYMTDSEDPVTPLGIMREIFHAKFVLTKGDMTMSFSPVYQMKPNDDGSFKVRLSEDFLRWSGAKEFAEHYASRRTLH